MAREISINPNRKFIGFENGVPYYECKESGCGERTRAGVWWCKEHAKDERVRRIG